MKIDKLIFEDSTTFIPGKDVDILIRIETSDIEWERSKVLQLNLITGGLSPGYIYLLKEIQNFFSEELRNGEIIEIAEVKYSFFDSKKNISHIFDILSLSDTEKSNIHINLLNIDISHDINNLTLNKIGNYCDSIKINVFGSCKEISINRAKKIKIQGGNFEIGKIILNEVQNKASIEIESVRKSSIDIINIALEKIEIEKVTISHSEIDFLQILGFAENKGIYIEKMNLYFNFLKKGFIKNVTFSNFNYEIQNWRI